MVITGVRVHFGRMLGPKRGARCPSIAREHAGRSGRDQRRPVSLGHAGGRPQGVSALAGLGGEGTIRRPRIESRGWLAHGKRHPQWQLQISTRREGCDASANRNQSVKSTIASHITRTSTMSSHPRSPINDKVPTQPKVD